MIKKKKTSDNTYRFFDDRTNDPIAIVHVSDADRWSKNKKIYSANWHPTFKSMYPATESLTFKNLETGTSMADVESNISASYDRIVKAKDQPDPLKTTLYSNSVDKEWKHPTRTDEAETKNYSVFHVHHPETDEPIANLYIQNKHMKDVGVDNRSFHGEYNKKEGRAFLEYYGHGPSDEQHKIIQTKYPENDPLSLLNQAKTYTELQTKEPSFVGKHMYDKTKIYTHKLSPEEAIDKYTEHLGKHYKTVNVKFDKVGPGLAMGREVGNYRTHVEHLIDARTPNELSHSTRDVKADDHYSNKPLNEVID